MKKAILIAAITLFAATAFAQQHLPPKVKLELTDKQVIELSNQIDSLYAVIQASDLPSKVANHRISKTQLALSPIWAQCVKQMVVDTVKGKKGAGK